MEHLRKHLPDHTINSLFPAEHFAAAAAQQQHLDGRPAAACREVLLGAGAYATVDGSASVVLVGQYSTKVAAMVRLEVMVPSEDTPDQGAFQISVDMSPISYQQAIKGKPPPEVSVLAQMLQDALGGPHVLNKQQLCISEGQAVWVVYLDIIVLDASGSLADACLLAAVTALRNTRLPAVHVTEAGNVDRDEVPPPGSSSNAAAEGRPLELGCNPVALTCGLYQQQLFLDPLVQEEALVESLVTVVVAEDDTILGTYKHGGRCAASSKQLAECISAAFTRHQQLQQQIQEALTALPPAPDDDDMEQ